MGKKHGFWTRRGITYLAGERDERYAVIHKSLCYPIVKIDRHNFITKILLYKNNNESLTSVFTHALYIFKNKFLIAYNYHRR